MSDRLFVALILILAIAVAVAAWQFRSLAWGDGVAASHLSGQSIPDRKPR